MNKLFLSCYCLFLLVGVGLNLFNFNPNSIQEVADFVQTPKEIGVWIKYWMTYTIDPKDIWQSAEESFTTKIGDCEDYAILAQEILRLKGIKSQIVHFIFMYNNKLCGHAVCAFKENDKYNYIGTEGYQAIQVDTLKDVALFSMHRVNKNTEFKGILIYTDNDIKRFIQEGLKKRNEKTTDK